MALNDYQIHKLDLEFLDTLENFSNFKEDQVEQSINNIRTPIHGVPDVMADDGTFDVSTVPSITPRIISKSPPP